MDEDDAPLHPIYDSLPPHVAKDSVKEERKQLLVKIQVQKHTVDTRWLFVFDDFNKCH